MIAKFGPVFIALLSIARAEIPLAEGPAKFLGNAAFAREGPTWDPAGYLYFVGKDETYRRDMQGKIEIIRQPNGRANSALLDPQRRLLLCEAGGRRIVRTERDGTLTVLADRFDGMRFNSPNDLALDSKGRVYFTDPRYGDHAGMEMRDREGKLVEGVYRIDSPGQVARIITHGIERPNGILVSPDDRYLYVADSNEDPGGTRKLLRFDLRMDGTIDAGSRQVIFDWRKGRGADGFKMDSAGRLYVAAGLNVTESSTETNEFKSGIYILSPAGGLLEFVPIGTTAQNCAFGDPDLRTLYVTGGGSLWSIRMSTPGRISAR